MASTSTIVNPAGGTPGQSGPALAATRVPLWPVIVQGVRVRAVLTTVLSLMMLAMGLLVGAMWPSLRGSFGEMASQLPPAFDALMGSQPLTTAVGWANAEMLSMVAPAATIAMGVISAAKATAAEEEDKTLAVMLALPLTRTGYLVARELSMIVSVLIVSAAVLVGLLIGNPLGDLGLGVANIVAASAACALIGILFGSIALALGAWSSQLRFTFAVAAGLAVAAFAASTFLPLSESVQWGAKLSPWYYYTSDVPLAVGANYGHFAVLLALSGVAFGLAVAALRRRDLRG